MEKILVGIFPPVTTPFNSDGELLIDKFKENLELKEEQRNKLTAIFQAAGVLEALENIQS
jgi:hypothetical protein